MNLAGYRDTVQSLDPSGGPYLTLSLDLTPAANGRIVATQVLKEAVRAAMNGGSAGFDDAEAVVAAAEAACEEAIDGGAAGLYFVGSAETSTVLDSPLPFRNHARTGSPWTFELERQLYFLGRPAVLVEVSRDQVIFRRIEAAEVAEEEEIDRTEHDTRSVKGRTNIEGRGWGGVRGSGGHSRNRVGRMIEERRAAAAREAVHELEAIRQPGDLVLMFGAEEPVSEFLNGLDDGVREDAIAVHDTHLPGDQRHIIGLAAKVSAEAQFEHADALVRQILSGGAGEQVARGRESVEHALHEGRVEQLVLHEDVVAHWGDATDARLHEPAWDDGQYEAILDAARRTSAGIAFCRLPELLEEHQGVVATTRW